ncbi:MAG: type IV pilus modification protein PilV [Betaproteobacteria bacterium]|nr:type IV pilus modification protein PilV [Betaproteobacteria bacterium]MDH5219773.1 type IV pilus modification protein PilV [Betaproteobacteria bacterium]MDH5351246.1 type IV pilus modification protein PilV [Betaproteobacteria bacterium]
MKKNQSGVALLEALVGILIFSIGILALMGLQAQSIRNTVEAKYRNEAAYLANQIIGQMWVDRANLADYDTTAGASQQMINWRAQVAGVLPSVVPAGANSPTIAVAGNQVTVTIFWQMPGADSPQRQFSVVAQINNS